MGRMREMGLWGYKGVGVGIPRNFIGHLVRKPAFSLMKNGHFSIS